MDRVEPYHFDLPHQQWRPHQFEVIQELLEVKDGSVYIIQALTGSGKTSFAAALGKDNRVIALAQTKLLQEENYGHTYKFAYLFGKGNYPCKLLDDTASRCQHKAGPRNCSLYNQCTYYNKKRAAMASSKCALNYAYFMTAKWPALRAKSPNYLVLDECHLLPDLVVEHASVTVTELDRKRWGLPDFPRIAGANSGISLFDRDKPESEAAKWLGQVLVIMKRHTERLELKYKSDKTVQKMYEEAQNLMYRTESTYKSLCEQPFDWFLRSGATARTVRNKRVPGFICKPLTARHHFPNIFLHGGKTILMSATIGNFSTFAEELGIKAFKTIRVPSVWGPEKRPVYYHDDAPSIGRKTDDAAWDRQARIITTMINSVPDSWSGVIHCTSKNQSNELAGRLARLGLGDRVWVPPLTGTNGQMAAWEVAKKQHKGRLAISWAWWVGVDLLDEKIAIAAKVPYGYIGSDYGQMRMRYDGKFYLQCTAWRLMQGCGRTRRGRIQDYDTDGHKTGLVAVVDSNWRRVRNYMDDDFLQSMNQWN